MAYQMNADSEIKLSFLNPPFAAKIRTMAEMLAQENITLIVTQGYRSWADQAALYAKGRTAPGPIVTNAPPGYSYHEMGVAADIAPEVIIGEIDWNPSHTQWQRAVQVGESLGLFSGTEFHSICDTPHFQSTGNFPSSPDDEVRQIYLQQGQAAFWQEVNNAV